MNRGRKKTSLWGSSTAKVSSFQSASYKISTPDSQNNLNVSTNPLNFRISSILWALIKINRIMMKNCQKRFSTFYQENQLLLSCIGTPRLCWDSTPVNRISTWTNCVFSYEMLRKTSIYCPECLQFILPKNWYTLMTRKKASIATIQGIFLTGFAKNRIKLCPPLKIQIMELHLLTKVMSLWLLDVKLLQNGPNLDSIQRLPKSTRYLLKKKRVKSKLFKVKVSILPCLISWWIGE